MADLFEKIFVFMIGSVFGSFLTLVAYQLPLNLSISCLRSHFYNYLKKIYHYQMIPIISQLSLKKQYIHYPRKILISFLLTEVISGSLFLLYQQSILDIIMLILCYMALSLSLTDFFYQLVEPKILYGFSLFILFLTVLPSSTNPIYWLDSLYFFLLLTLLNVYIPNGIGLGDIKLLTIWSLFLGYYPLLRIILFACFSCLVFLTLRKLFRLKPDLTKIPFVPFLTFGLYLHLLLQL